jgi:hypothetical protein
MILVLQAIWAALELAGWSRQNSKRVDMAVIFADPFHNPLARTSVRVENRIDFRTERKAAVNFCRSKL